MQKKYFLMDAELENTKGDFFNSNDLKKNIFVTRLKHILVITFQP